jgi:hypothetical protein
MAWGIAGTGTRWFETEFILSIARRIYLVVAGISLLAVIVALGLAFLFELGTWRSAPEVPMPAEYVEHPLTMDASDVQTSLSPPRNLEFVVLQPYVQTPATGQEELGYFNAETPNGLAAFPNDFDIIGGRDADLFDRAPIAVSGVARAGLRPSAQFLEQMNREPGTGTHGGGRQYSIQIVARDRFGNRSPPASVSFGIGYGPPLAAPVPEDAHESDLEHLARDIAVLVDPAKTPAYFDAYKQALDEPGRCGSASDNENFVSQYRTMFDRLRKRLHASNIGAFYAGVCSSWSNAVARAAQERDAAESARGQAMQRNAEARIALMLQNAGLSIGKGVALWAAGAALVVFLFITLFLAFLAIESHSNALRNAVELLAGKDND